MTISARDLLNTIKTGTALRSLTPVEGEGVPQGLFVKALAFAEHMEIEACGDAIEAAWTEMRTAQKADAGDIKHEIVLLSIAMTLSHGVVDAAGDKVLFVEDPLPDGWMSFDKAAKSLSGVQEDKPKNVDQMWDAVCRCMAYIPSPAMLMLFKAIRDAGRKRSAEMGKDSAATPSPGS